MFDLELILSYHNLKKNHIDCIKTHIWIEVATSEFGTTTYCEKCKVDFGSIIYRQYGQDGVHWHTLTCDEILIKNLLE